MNSKPCLMALILGTMSCAVSCSGPVLPAGDMPDDDAADDDDAAEDDDTAEDDDGADDDDSALESTHWRVVNGTGVDDHWNISELTFFMDIDCTVSLSDEVTDILTVSENDCDEDDPDLLNDGVCTFSGHCESGNWANEPSESGVGQIWAGYVLGEASSVGCLTLCQGMDDIQRVTELSLEQSDDGGGTWMAVETLVTETVEVDIPTVFVVE